MTDHLESATRQYLVQEIDRLRRENALLRQLVDNYRMASRPQSHTVLRQTGLCLTHGAYYEVDMCPTCARDIGICTTPAG